MKSDEKILIKKWEDKVRLVNAPDEELYKVHTTDFLYHQSFDKYLSQYISLKFHNKVLCIGAHGGHWIYRIDKETHIKVSILDMSIKYLEMPMHLYPHFNYNIASSKQLPYKDRKFHLIFVNQPFESFFHSEQFLNELNRVLKKKGTLYIYIKRTPFSKRRAAYIEQIEDAQLEIVQATTFQRIEIFEIRKKLLDTAKG